MRLSFDLGNLGDLGVPGELPGKQGFGYESILPCDPLTFRGRDARGGGKVKDELIASDTASDAASDLWRSEDEHVEKYFMRIKFSHRFLIVSHFE